MILKFAGFLVILLGIGLFIRNTTGIFPTFSYAGFITMLAGGVISSIGDDS